MINKQDLLRETKRKLIHACGILTLFPLILLPEHLKVKVFALFVAIALFLNWYWSRRQLREKYFKQMISDLPHEHKHNMLKGAEQIKKFEENVLFGFLKDVARKKEREPLAATFYYLLSALFALVVFGLPYAIFGLFAIAIGDCAATLIGKPFGKHKIPWNSEKSVEGFIGFFAATAFSIFAFLYFMPQFAVFDPLILSIIAGMAGAAIETIPTVNDNSSIPVGVGFIIWIFALV